VDRLWRNPRRPRPREPARGSGPACADPHLVTILRNHIDTFGLAGDGRLFTNEHGGVVGSSTYYRVWQETPALALPPAAVTLLLAARRYDLRHSALSTWLNSGVDATEVAERAGNSVEVC
jgi:integrase